MTELGGTAGHLANFAAFGQYWLGKVLMPADRKVGIYSSGDATVLDKYGEALDLQHFISPDGGHNRECSFMGTVPIGALGDRDELCDPQIGSVVVLSSDDNRLSQRLGTMSAVINKYPNIREGAIIPVFVGEPSIELEGLPHPDSVGSPNGDKSRVPSYSHILERAHQVTDDALEAVMEYFKGKKACLMGEAPMGTCYVLMLKRKLDKAGMKDVTVVERNGIPAEVADLMRGRRVLWVDSTPYTPEGHEKYVEVRGQLEGDFAAGLELEDFKLLLEYDPTGGDIATLHSLGRDIESYNPLRRYAETHGTYVPVHTLFDTPDVRRTDSHRVAK